MRKRYELWKEAEIPVPPCFVIVCNNTATSKLVFDYVSGFHRENEDGSVDHSSQGKAGRCFATTTSMVTAFTEAEFCAD